MLYNIYLLNNRSLRGKTMILPKITFFVVLIVIITFFTLGYGIYKEIYWIPFLSMFVCSINGLAGFTFGAGPACAGVMKNPTKSETVGALILIGSGFVNALLILVAAMWLLYK